MIRESLRADLDSFCELHAENNPRPRTAPARLDHVAATRERLKASVDRPLDRRRFLRLVNELAASYEVGHIFTPLAPAADWNAWAARGGRVPSYEARTS
jgi:hypothetical protein